ncbi:MAG TPA: hypothetical protein VGD56_01360, partial [Gemmatirosa sp.]
PALLAHVGPEAECQEELRARLLRLAHADAGSAYDRGLRERPSGPADVAPELPAVPVLTRVPAAPLPAGPPAVAPTIPPPASAPLLRAPLAHEARLDEPLPEAPVVDDIADLGTASWHQPADAWREAGGLRPRRAGRGSGARVALGAAVVLLAFGGALAYGRHRDDAAEIAAALQARPRSTIRDTVAGEIAPKRAATSPAAVAPAVAPASVPLVPEATGAVAPAPAAPVRIAPVPVVRVPVAPLVAGASAPTPRAASTTTRPAAPSARVAAARRDTVHRARARRAPDPLARARVLIERHAGVPTLSVGTTMPLVAWLVDSTGRVVGSGAVHWASSNPSVLDVTGGVARARRAQAAAVIVTARIGNKRAQLRVRTVASDSG